MSCASRGEEFRRRHAAPAWQHFAEYERHVAFAEVIDDPRQPILRREHIIVGERDDVAAARQAGIQRETLALPRFLR